MLRSSSASHLRRGLLFIRSLQNSYDGHLSHLKVRLYSLSHRMAAFLELVNPRSLNQVLYVRFFLVKLLQRVQWAVVRLLCTVNSFSFVILMKYAKSCIDSQRMSVIINVTLFLIEKGHLTLGRPLIVLILECGYSG